jgi:hypothetical protein
MAKRKKGKTVQMLSPENYIRQKARSLPLYECHIRKDWEEDGLAYITVARKHNNGNLTIGTYLVDLKLLGVKEALYLFNISETEYRDLLKEFHEKIGLEPASYVLVHNIIFAGIEFAEDYGFKPHKTFTSVAQYILEEDTDAIEMIEIECGENNMPVYIRGPLESESRARQIIAQLEAKAGPGNYRVIWQSEEDFMEDDDSGDDFDVNDQIDELEKRFKDFSIDEKVDLIFDQANRIKELSKDEQKELGYLINSVLNEYIDYELLDELSEELTDKLLEYEITENYSDELLGINANSKIDRKKWSQQFDELVLLAQSKPASAGKKIKKLQKEMPDNPALAFLELMVLQAEDSFRYDEKTAYYHKLFPHYPLIKLMWTTSVWATDRKANPIEYIKRGPEEFFAGKEALHSLEMLHYLHMLIIIAVVTANATLFELVDMILEEIDFPGYDKILTDMITIAKMNFIHSLKEERPFPEAGIKKAKRREKAETFQFKIQIQGITKPPVWRRLTVPSNYSFYDFHFIIQAVFGWTNSHLFEFSERGFGSEVVITEIHDDPDSGDNEQIEAREVKLSEVFKEENQKFVYIYDFGDSWEHTIILEKILPEMIISPILITGKGKCPPEDCGGIWGYEEFKAIMADRKHPGHDEYAEWIGLEEGEEWNPKEFDPEEAQYSLNQLFLDN